MVAAWLAACAPMSRQPALPPDQLPMYGSMDRAADAKLKRVDEALIESATREFGSRQAASQHFVETGFRYLSEDQLDVAMRDFNRGWLLNPENPGVYYGFMRVLSGRFEYCEAYRVSERAFEYGFGMKAEVLADAGGDAARCARSDTTLDEATKLAFTRRYSELYTQALQLHSNDAYVYLSWAGTSFFLDDYATAWRYVKLARQNGGEPPKFLLQMLTEKMPEPK
jgi:hypothetical protein